MLRREGRQLEAAAQARVAAIGAADRFIRGPWPDLRPLPTCIADIEEVGPGADGHGAIPAGVCIRAGPLADAVATVANWIVSGEVPDAWRAMAEAAAGNLLNALDSGVVRVVDTVEGRIALVTGFVPGSLTLAFRRAPVVIAEGAIPSPDGSAPIRLRRAERFSATSRSKWIGCQAGPGGMSDIRFSARCIRPPPTGVFADRLA